MGWTEYRATHFKNGVIDRKAEIDSLWNGEKCKLLKSSMVGNVYYGAVKKIETEEVFAVIFLTHTRQNFWFSYKDMDETAGPFNYDCPVSILKLLTPTKYENAKEWRKKCYEYHNKRKENKTISTLPIGSIIKFSSGTREIKLTKRAPAFQFKTPWWETESGNYYSKKDIPKNFEILQS